MTLKPGERWSPSWTILEDIYNWQIRDTWHYQFKGGVVDWWDYGGVWTNMSARLLRCHRVTDPVDNGGGLEFVISASNAIEISIVRKG